MTETVYKKLIFLIPATCAAIGQVFIGWKWIDATARNPEAADKVRNAAIIGVSFLETSFLLPVIISAFIMV